MEYVVRHPRTRMFIADHVRNPRYPRGTSYKWVRDLGDARAFKDTADAAMPEIVLGLRRLEICPLLSCGLVGDPIDD